MPKVLFIALLVAGLLGPATSTAAEDIAVRELSAPRSPERGEAIELQVTTGSLPRGARLTVMTEDGTILGAVTPFGQEFRRAPTVATIRIPRSAISDRRMRVKLEVIEPGAPPRPPRPGEVEALDLLLVPQS